MRRKEQREQWRTEYLTTQERRAQSREIPEAAKKRAAQTQILGKTFQPRSRYRNTLKKRQHPCLNEKDSVAHVNVVHYKDGDDCGEETHVEHAHKAAFRGGSDISCEQLTVLKAFIRCATLRDVVDLRNWFFFQRHPSGSKGQQRGGVQAGGRAEVQAHGSERESGVLYTDGVDLRPSIHIRPRRAGGRVRFGAKPLGHSAADSEYEHEGR